MIGREEETAELWKDSGLPDTLQGLGIETFTIGHNVREAKGKDVHSWKTQSSREHLVHAYEHVGKALGGHKQKVMDELDTCLLYTSPSPRDGLLSRMPSSA